MSRTRMIADPAPSHAEAARALGLASHAPTDVTHAELQPKYQSRHRLHTEVQCAAGPVQIHSRFPALFGVLATEPAPRYCEATPPSATPELDLRYSCCSNLRSSVPRPPS